MAIAVQSVCIATAVCPVLELRWRVSLTAIAGSRQISPVSLHQLPWSLGAFVLLSRAIVRLQLFCSASRVNRHLALAKLPACDHEALS